MRVLVAGAMRKPGSWFTTRETVDGWTLARAASSFSVVGTASRPQLTFVPRVNTIGQSFVHGKGSPRTAVEFGGAQGSTILAGEGEQCVDA